MTYINPQSIKDAGYEFNQLEDNIYQIKNFLTEKDLAELLLIIDNSTEDDWGATKHYTKHLEDRAEELTGKRDIEAAGIEVTHNWDDKVTSLFGKTYLEQDLAVRVSRMFEKDCGLDFRSFGTIQRMYEGTELKSHYDEKADKRHVWASVAYITDDYNDGELFFTHKGIEIKPEKGSLMVFPATEEYEHGVHSVSKGPIRYVLPAFIFDHSRAEDDKN